jgi:hypothetical protein
LRREFQMKKLHGIGAMAMGIALMLGGCGSKGDPSCSDVADHAWDILSKKLPDEMKKDSAKIAEMKKQIVAACEKEGTPEEKKCVMDSDSEEKVEACIAKTKGGDKK